MVNPNRFKIIYRKHCFTILSFHPLEGIPRKGILFYPLQFLSRQGKHPPLTFHFQVPTKWSERNMEKKGEKNLNLSMLWNLLNLAKSTNLQIFIFFIFLRPFTVHSWIFFSFTCTSNKNCLISWLKYCKIDMDFLISSNIISHVPVGKIYMKRKLLYLSSQFCLSSNTLSIC